MLRLSFFALIVLIINIGPAVAQLDDCPALVRQVLQQLSDVCMQTGRNEACYGHVALHAQPQASAADFKFEQVSDIENVLNIAALRLQALDVQQDIWGIALMQLQTSLPDALLGQNVTFVVFGDTEMVNLAADASVPTDHARPMQAFYLRTSLGEMQCNQAPASGLLVRTPQGLGEVHFSVNGVDVAMGSVLFFQSEPGGLLTIDTYTGSAFIRSPYGDYPIIAGTRLSFPVDVQSRVNGPPLPLTPHDDALRPLLQDLYPDLTSPAPLSASQMALLMSLLDSGLPPCGVADFLPACDALIHSAGGSYCPMTADGLGMDCTGAYEMIWHSAYPDYSSVSIWDWEATPGTQTSVAEVGPALTEPDLAELPPDITTSPCVRQGCALAELENSHTTTMIESVPGELTPTIDISSLPVPIPLEPDLPDVPPPDAPPTELPDSP